MNPFKAFIKACLKFSDDELPMITSTYVLFIEKEKNNFKLIQVIISCSVICSCSTLIAPFSIIMDADFVVEVAFYSSNEFSCF